MEREGKTVGMIVQGDYSMDPRVQKEAEALVENGFEVHVICTMGPMNLSRPRPPKSEKIRGVQVHRIPVGMRRSSIIRYVYEYIAVTLLGIWRLLQLHFTKRLDVVHIHNMPDFLVVAGLPCKWMGAVLILDVHDPMSELFQAKYRINKDHRFIRALRIEERISYRLADHLLTVSTPMKENIARKRGLNDTGISVVHNFPDLTIFPINDSRKTWPVNRDRLVLLYCGTVTEHYRLDIAVRAIAKASETIPDVRLQIVGGGNRITQVLALANDLGIRDKVIYIKQVSQDKLVEIMGKSDIGISTHEAGPFDDLYFSTKILEFMSQALPVISSRTYTIDQYIPEDAVFYFEPEYVDDLVQKIIYMYNNPGLVMEKIQNSTKLVSEYNWQREKGSFVSFYENLLSG